jgi:hypothetical protein
MKSDAATIANILAPEPRILSNIAKRSKNICPERIAASRLSFVGVDINPFSLNSFNSLRASSFFF